MIEILLDRIYISYTEKFRKSANTMHVKSYICIYRGVYIHIPTHVYMCIYRVVQDVCHQQYC